MPLSTMVTIQARSTGEDAYGQPVTGWTDVCAVWAEVRHPSGVEYLRADAVQSTIRASIKVRLRNDITAAMRVLVGTTVYNIKAVLPDLVSRAFMFLACEVVQ